MLNHLRLAFRIIAKSPGFSIVAILTLALGIGLSASSFSLANAFLLRNAPYPEPERLLRIFATSRLSTSDAHAPGNLIDLREAATSFSGFSLYCGDAYTYGESGQPVEQVQGLAATADFFDVLGVHPSLGRGFTAGEDEPGRPDVVVLTHRTWVRRFAADPAIVGRTIRLNARPFTVVGVLPDAFEAPLVWGPLEFIVPFAIQPAFRTQRADGWLQGVARLKPGVTLRQARAELNLLGDRLVQAYPKENDGRGLRAVGLSQSNMDGVSRSLLWLMTGISVAMLLIACANLASLQVARAFVRSREFAVRSALGGSRGQLMAPLMVESLVLAAIGGVGGLLVATWSNAIIGSMLIINNEPGFAIPVDGRVLAFAAAGSILSGVAFGFAPAWLASRAPAAEALKEGSRSSVGNRSHQRLKHALIVGELALALTLVGVAAAFGLGAKSFVQRQVGWNIDGLFTGYLAMPYTRYGDDAHCRDFHRTLAAKLAAIPGVEHAAIAENLPLFAIGGTVPLAIDGRPPEEAARRPVAQVGTVTDDYFATLQIPLREGSLFAPGLTEKDPAVIIVNESFARRFWPGQSAIGRRVRLGDDPTPLEIVGVAGDVGLLARFDRLDTPFQIYRPLLQTPKRYVALVLRTKLAPEALTKSVREAVASIDPELPVAQPGSLSASFERNLSNLNLVTVNLAVSAGMGLLIAAVGLFGVISQLTAQRTRDIGVRMALGASGGDILRLILGEGVKLMVIGIAIGIPAYLALTMVLQRAMPSMRLPGLWLLATNVAVLGGTMLVACWLPARRAARVDPTVSLRAD